MDKEMEKVKEALEDFGKKVVDAVKKGKGEADKVTRAAQVRIETGSLNRQLKDLYQELGEQFYKNLRKPSKKGEEEVAETVGHIGEVEKSINSLNRTLKALKGNKPVPGKRGRSSKAASEEQAPKRRGRPPKAAAAKTKSAAPRRRGRPPKSAAGS